MLYHQLTIFFVCRNESPLWDYFFSYISPEAAKEAVLPSFEQFFFHSHFIHYSTITLVNI